MSRTEMKTSGGHLLGFTRADGNGRLVVYNSGSQPLGYYDPRTNTTRAMGGQILARGDTTAVLLLEDE